MKPLIYTGTDRGYQDFCQRFEISPAELPLVREVEKLYGFKDRTLVYGWGYHWLPKDRIIGGYCRTHDILIMSERDFTVAYFAERNR